MGIQRNNLLTASEIMHILIGSIIGIGILSLPNSLIENAYQDSWISVTIGSIYPIYIILLIIFIVNRYPKDNILVLSKKYCGTFIGTILNFAFLTFFSYIQVYL
ncbi:MAG: GerAB/ArcD/ProY family transporter [Clostridiaceae bacterium]|nr:GerAB/ArcD/ProY family transporter [Clostridiaceae bacterium]